MNVHSISPKTLLVRHKQLLREISNGQPLETSQVPHVSILRRGFRPFGENVNVNSHYFWKMGWEGAVGSWQAFIFQWVSAFRVKM